MAKSNQTKWLKVLECAVVGLATWLVVYGEICDFSASVPNPIPYTVESSRRSEHKEANRQFLLFLLKLSFQVLLALREGTQDTKAKQVFWCKWVLWMSVVR